MLLVLGVQWAVDAAEVTFTRKYVDSNTYSNIVYATKYQTTSYATVIVNQIFKADGTSSNYKYVYCRVAPDGESVLVTKGNSYDLKIPTGLQVPGQNILLQAKGHNASLDCQISGMWNAH